MARASERFYDYVSKDKVACGSCVTKVVKKLKKGNDLHPPVPVSPLDLSSPHSGKYHGGSFSCDYLKLNVWILWLSAFISLLGESLPELTPES